MFILEKKTARIALLFFLCMLLLNSCENMHGNEKNAQGVNTQANFTIQDSVILGDSLFALDTAFVDQTVVPTKKINKKNLVVKEWNTDVRTNVRVLDHVTTYNANGQKIEEIEYNSEGLKWRERYDYGSNGEKVRELIYNGNNRLIQVKKYQYNVYGKKTITYTYNANGKLIAVKNYEYLMQE